ncbi:MAG: [LysW]-aminoadipate kinase [Candidatus Freyarchaeota archaeon]|nr:[LysW]-aminoadipate kinase [Candidatus Bathyarchaeota archaeon]
MRLVVKIGGSVLDRDISDIARDVRRLRDHGEEVVLVHGGARKVTEVAERMGKKQRFVLSVSGFRSRYTDKETAEIYTMVISGLLNKHIVASLSREGVRSVGLSGIDGFLIKAERKERIKVREGGKVILIDGDYTGKIVEVNRGLLGCLLSAGYVPVIGSVAIGQEGEFLNVDGDRAAASVAGAIGADVLVLLTDVPGVLDGGKLVRMLSRSEARLTVPKLEGGMRRKVFAALEALDAGVKKVFISSGLDPEPITSTLRGKECTVMVNE